MKIIKVESCHTCPYIARKPYSCWYCGKTGITIDDIEGIHPDCPLPDHLPDATKKVETDHSVEANKMMTAAREDERNRIIKSIEDRIDKHNPNMSAGSDRKRELQKLLKLIK